MIAALPLTNAKKKLTPQTLESSVTFFLKVASQLMSLHSNVLQKVLYLEELFFQMAAFVASKPCSLVHLIYEKSIITETNVPSDMIVFPAGPKKLPIQDFLTKGLREVYPFVNRYIDTTDFQDFFTKFSLVIREQILKSMRNKAR